MEYHVMQRIEQAILQESTFPQHDQLAREDEMLFRLQELEASGILTAEEVEDCLADFRRVFHYEGRS